jgi:hypothetical protein
VAGEKCRYGRADHHRSTRSVSLVFLDILPRARVEELLGTEADARSSSCGRACHGRAFPGRSRSSSYSAAPN